MGDVLHAMPAVAALRELHPDWVIGWAIEPVWRELLQAESEFHDVAWRLSGRDSRRPLVDKWSWVPTRNWKRRPFSLNTLRDIRALRRELLGDRYDLCVDLQGSIRSAMVGRMAGAARFVGAAAPREAPAAWFYKRKFRLSATHVVEQGCELLGSAVGETLRPAKVTLPVDPAAEQWCDASLAGVAERFALIAPTAGWGAKRWPTERYGAVAAALERPVVGLFGPTDPARNGPYGTQSRVLRHGSSRVDHSRHLETEEGLMQITTDEVVEAALELLRAGRDKVNL